MTVVRATLATPVPAERPATTVRAQAAIASVSQPPRRGVVASAACEDLDMLLLLSLKVPPMQGRLATLAGGRRSERG
jgi:hypothetical protein